MRNTLRSAFSTRTLAVGLGLVLLGTALTSAPAAAKPGGGADAPTSGTAANCVVLLQRGDGASGPARCFTTFTAAIRHATNGAVSDAPATAALAAKDVTFAEKLAGAGRRAPSAAVVQENIIGIEYDATDYGLQPWSMVFMGNAACTPTTDDVEYQYAMPEYLGDVRIWDRISSYQNFFEPARCWTDHYYLSGFGVPRTGFTSSQATMPQMNIGGGPYSGDNNTRSLRWS